MQIRGDFSIGNALHGDIHLAFTLGLRGDRVAALGLISILGSQADVIMLTSAMSHPGRKFQCERFYARRLRLDVRDRSDLPVEGWFHRYSDVIASPGAKQSPYGKGIALSWLGLDTPNVHGLLDQRFLLATTGR